MNSDFLARIAFGLRFGTFLGSILGSFWARRSLKPVLEFVLERSRAAPERFYSALEASKSRASGLQEASRLPLQLQELSKGLQDRFSNNFETILEPSWNHFGAILGVADDYTDVGRLLQDVGT